MDKVAKPTVGNKCEHCGTDVYVISGGFWVHTLNGISRCPDKSAPSKESLERARKWWKALAPNSETQFIRKMALEFDAIARERDEVTEKLAEALRNASQYAYHRAICNVRLFPPDPCNCEFNQMMDCVEAALANYQAAKGEHQ